MSSVSGISGSASDIQTSYLNLLVTQLQNQNPLEPMSNSDMTSQLAQISQLEHLENIDNKFQKTLLSAQANEAMEMVGRELTFIPPGESKVVTEVAEGVFIVNGEISLKAGKYNVGLEDVLAVGKYATQVSEAMAVVGREITFIPPGGNMAVTEVVDGVSVVDGEVVLEAGIYNIAIEDILAVGN